MIITNLFNSIKRYLENTPKAETPSKKAVNVVPDRPSFQEIFMDLAESVARRSTCVRLSVGAVATTTDFRKVLSIGYNGNASGLPNTCNGQPGGCHDIHAESNMVINMDSPRSVEKYVFVTHSPCLMCAKMLINMGNVKKVYYRNEYRDTSGMDILRQVGIEVIHYKKDNQ